MNTSPSASLTIPGPAGVELSFETHGDPASPLTIVLIHGGYQSRRCFKDQYAVLASGHFVVGIDLPGHGRSSLPEDNILSLTLYAESVQAVISELHLTERPIVLVGWSFGGAVCGHYLDLFGQEMKVIGLIQLASFLGGFEAYFSHLGRDPFFHPVLNSAGEIGTSSDIALLHENFINNFFERLTFSRLDDDTYDSVYGYNERAWWNFLPLGNVFLTNLPPDDATQRLKNQAIPTLLLHGKNDALVPLSYSREVAGLLPHAELIEIDQCGHSAMLEQPTLVNREIVNFLADLPHIVTI